MIHVIIVGFSGAIAMNLTICIKKKIGNNGGDNSRLKSLIIAERKSTKLAFRAL